MQAYLQTRLEQDLQQKVKAVKIREQQLTQRGTGTGERDVTIFFVTDIPWSSVCLSLHTNSISSHFFRNVLSSFASISTLVIIACAFVCSTC